MKKIIISLISIIVVVLVFWQLYPGQIVKVYGDKSFDGATVFVNGRQKGTMVWDKENDRAYARDLRFLGQFSPSLVFGFPDIRRDTMKLKLGERGPNVDIKVVTKDGKVYLKQYRNMEDIAYFTHYLMDFEVIQK